jgi:hypothetical protein
MEVEAMSKKTAAENPKRVPVGERALINRVNRILKKDDQKLFTLKGGAADEFGRYVVVPIPNLATAIAWGRRGPLSRVEKGTYDLEGLAREYGALADWETLASKEVQP